jgi:hypothetical protein
LTLFLTRNSGFRGITLHGMCRVFLFTQGTIVYELISSGFLAALNCGGLLGLTITVHYYGHSKSEYYIVCLVLYIYRNETKSS